MHESHPATLGLFYPRLLFNSTNIFAGPAALAGVCAPLSTILVGNAAVKNTAQCDVLGGGYNYDSTAIRPRYDHSTTYVTIGLLHCCLNK